MSESVAVSTTPASLRARSVTATSDFGVSSGVGNVTRTSLAAAALATAARKTATNAIRRFIELPEELAGALQRETHRGGLGRRLRIAAHAPADRKANLGAHRLRPFHVGNAERTSPRVRTKNGSAARIEGRRRIGRLRRR